MISERIKELERLCAERGKAGRPSHFGADYHSLFWGIDMCSHPFLVFAAKGTK